MQRMRGNPRSSGMRKMVRLGGYTGIKKSWDMPDIDKELASSEKIVKTINDNLEAGNKALDTAQEAFEKAQESKDQLAGMYAALSELSDDFLETTEGDDDSGMIAEELSGTINNLVSDLKYHTTPTVSLRAKLLKDHTEYS